MPPRSAKASVRSAASCLTLGPELFKVFLQLPHKLDAAAIRDVPAVGEDVEPDPLRAVLIRALKQLLELLVPRVHASVAQQADQMEGVSLEGLLHVGKPVTLEEVTGLESGVHQACALLVHLSGSCQKIKNKEKKNVRVRWSNT